MMAAATPATVDAALRDAAALLAGAGIESARLDAEVLLAWAGGWQRAELLIRLRDALPDTTRQRFVRALRRRVRREPVAYITGVKEFWSLSFAVTADVLVPRPETELLVEAVSLHVAGRASALVCDVGTGSGCIAVAVAHANPAVRVVAIDVSPPALRIAMANAARHGVAARVDVVGSDLFSALPAAPTFDVIASNPPYLADQDPGAPELAWEPELALRAGPHGLDVIAYLIATASLRLRPGGLLAVEIGAGQERAAHAIATAAGFAAVRVRADLAGLPRLLLAERGGTA